MRTLPSSLGLLLALAATPAHAQLGIPSSLPETAPPERPPLRAVRPASASAAGTSPARLLTGTHRRHLDHGGRRRHYWVHLPDGEPPEEGWPVLLAFHGLFMTGRGFGSMTRLHQVGKEAGFVTVYPDGIGSVPQARSWNAGECCLEATLRGVDDIGFAGALMDRVMEELPSDPRRLWLVGFSNGGMLVYRLLERYGDRVAAAALVAATSFPAAPKPPRPVPLLAIHGTEDPYVPFAGNLRTIRFGWPRMPPVRARLAGWAAAYGAEGEPYSEVVAEAEHVRHETWSGRAPVELYTLAGAGHSWPGGPPFATNILGEPDPALDASAVIAAFLAKHSLPPAPVD